MIYAAFTFWLLLILFTGIGLYRLWTKLLKPPWVNWALLPGTVVSEMAYIFGCLITGGEIRRARLIDTPRDAGGRRRGGQGAATEATPKLKVVGPVIAALVAVVACGAGILVVHALLGEPAGDAFAGSNVLKKNLPVSWDGFWNQARLQLSLLQRMCETLADMDWLNWRTGVFVYLAACLSVRLAPVRRPIRPTLAAAVVISAVIAVVAALSKSFKDLMADLWPLLTYVWASLLLMLFVTLTFYGLVLLVRILAGKGE